MERRAFLAAMLAAATSSGRGLPPPDALLVGDSLAYQLGPRLRAAMAARGRQLAWRGRGGTSVRQWLRKGWLRDAVRRRPAPLVLICLGTNCTPAERPGLRADVEAMAAAVPEGRRILWLLPPPLRYPTDHVTDAVREAGVRSFAPGPLPMEWDSRIRRPDVHPTDAGHRRWAALLVDELWPL